MKGLIKMIRENLFAWILLELSLITILLVNQIVWVNGLYNDVVIINHRQISFYDSYLFRSLASVILGAILGFIYPYFLRKKLSPPELKKLAVAHTPVFLYWLYLGSIIAGNTALAKAMLFVIPTLFYLLLEVFFLWKKSMAEWKEKIRPALLIAFFLASTVCFFAPLQMFLSNPNEFNLTFPVTAIYSALVFLPVFAALVRILLFFPLKNGLFERAGMIMFGIGLAAWIQGNILLWNYGALDGSRIYWDKYLLNGITDIAVWAVILVSVSVVKIKPFFQFFRKAALFLILIQGCYAILYAVNQISRHENQRLTAHWTSLSEDNKFDFSSRTNIIVLILDESQSDIFQQILQEKPEYKKTLEGFTYYCNNTSGASFTTSSIAGLLTGVLYDNSETYSEYINNTYSRSILKTLSGNGYQVEFYSHFGDALPMDPKLVANARGKADLYIISKQMSYIYDTVLFRYVPQLLKPAVYDESRWFLSKAFTDLFSRDITYQDIPRKYYPVSQYLLRYGPDFQFFYSMLIRGRVSQTSRLFKFYHTEGMHIGLIYGENHEVMTNDYCRQNYTSQYKGMLKFTGLFLDNLRRIGAYDNSMIMIMGDHGSAHTPDMYIPPLPSTAEENKKRFNQINFSYYKTRALPLLLIKPFNAKGDLRTSSAPVSLMDIPATIADAAGLKSDFSGKSIFKIGENEIRKRYYHAFPFSSAYHPDITEYVIDGDAWLDKSWKNTGRIFKTEDTGKSLKK